MFISIVLLFASKLVRKQSIPNSYWFHICQIYLFSSWRGGGAAGGGGGGREKERNGDEGVGFGT